MKVLYFAWLRTKIGCAEEEIELPKGAHTVAEVLDLLRARGENYAEALSAEKVIRVAVNQDYAQEVDMVKNEDEFAIFPPVTGG
ncbi:Molybdopterin synthase sulfur carrier subunit [Candidatus Terasakiella magnetica]|uniref:Molybdopterin synthase sulfur carrier subunit n=1 Tax=Candidatus Terasakiella magnetica TaxID=1867952 RepID=A0A1C3RLR1_9PROT|nr:molybdopterin converting factor subunit 1 [Candidatus Terasakiella magnetica]SCA58250.1 Molybdopterin synthase sulfur carrier subunit [Candidatus Terasakiella magnetica]